MNRGSAFENEPQSPSRAPEEVRHARRNKRRDWVRKGGLLDIASWLLLPLFVIVAVTAVKMDTATSRGTRSDWIEFLLWLVATIGFGAIVTVWMRNGRPRAIGPEGYVRISQWALDKSWNQTEPPDGDPFNRRLVAGQVGDSHRTIAYFAAGANAKAPAVFVHGVSKHSSEDQAKKEATKRRAAEIVYAVWVVALELPMDRVVVATPADDPDSPIEPFDSTARRFESNRFNGAYRVLSNDRRIAHTMFDPALLDVLLELRSHRVRLLWEEDLAYVACELELVDDAVVDKIPWVLERMRRNATLVAP